MLKLRRTASGSLHLWKRELKMARMASFSSSAENANRQMTTPKTNKQIATKSSVYDKLQSLTSETLDFIMREEEKKKGVSVTKSDLVGWAEQLDKDGKHEYALKIYEWMDKKKMVLSPSEHAVFADLLAKCKGFDAARDYFEKLDPDFDEDDLDSKNWPAYIKLIQWLRRGDKESGIVRAVRLFYKGDPVHVDDY